MQRLNNLQTKDHYAHITGHESLDAAASEAEAWFERQRTDQRFFNPSGNFGPEGTNHITDLSGATGEVTNGCRTNDDTYNTVDGTFRHDVFCFFVLFLVVFANSCSAPCVFSLFVFVDLFVFSCLCVLVFFVFCLFCFVCCFCLFVLLFFVCFLFVWFVCLFDVCLF